MLRRLGLVCALILAVCAVSPPALAESIHVSASADAKKSPTQARQQALERALVEAVCQEAQRMLPSPAPQARLDALRAHLSPHAVDYVLSYQESGLAAASGEEAKAQEPASAPASPFTLELDVTIQRTYLRSTLVGLGFFAGDRHPGTYLLRLGAGVKEKDVQALATDDALLGLTRVKQAAPAEGRAEVTLERLPQGYYKATLRHKDVVLAADAAELPALWLQIWSKYFSDSRMLPGPGKQVLTISGFSGVDAVQGFVQLMAAWDDAVQDPSLAGMDIGMDGVSGRFSCRVLNQEALNARLREALPGRKLTLSGQAGVAAP
ncbi:hypothetical protein [Humidesulfovibrio idahonensis]